MSHTCYTHGGYSKVIVAPKMYSEEEIDIVSSSWDGPRSNRRDKNKISSRIKAHEDRRKARRFWAEVKAGNYIDTACVVEEVSDIIPVCP
jgi:hypothetical protein